MIQIQSAQAMLALAQAKVGSEDARAKQLLADAELKLSQVQTSQQEAQVRRAEVAHKITQDVRNSRQQSIGADRMPGGMRQRPKPQQPANEAA
jgi:hypothetical protein